jgi:hypothetical protein
LERDELELLELLELDELLLELPKLVSTIVVTFETIVWTSDLEVLPVSAASNPAASAILRSLEMEAAACPDGSI